MSESDLMDYTVKAYEFMPQPWLPVRTNYQTKAPNIMDLIETNRNITRLLRKTKDRRKRTLLQNIIKANSKIIITL